MTRRTAAVVSAVVVVAAAGATVVALAGRGDGGAERTAGALPPASAQVTRQTLRETLDVDGELGYGPTLTATSRRGGTVTWLPAAGAEVGRGQPLCRIDDAPVVLLHGSMPAYRTMAPGTEGADVAQLEQNLRALGYQGFTVDDEYTDATADAVERWQEKLGLPETGTVELGRVVFASGTVRVDSVEAEVGQAVASGAPGTRLLTYTGTATIVTVDLDVEDRAVAKAGNAVSVTMPDGARVPGKVTAVATVIEPGSGQDAEPTTRVEALVALDDPQAGRDLGQAAVDVTFTASERRDVLTVPVAALVALEAGGFGVEVVEGDATRHVPVTTGLFAGGRVEISGDGLTEGMTVGMPA